MHNLLMNKLIKILHETMAVMVFQGVVGVAAPNINKAIFLVPTKVQLSLNNNTEKLKVQKLG